MHDERNRDRGTILVVCVALLAVLGLLGASFALVLRVERDAARLVGWQVEADLAAEAGLARSEAGLRALALGQMYDSIHDPWIYDPQPAIGAFGPLGPVVGTGIDLAAARRPSFAHDTNGDGIFDSEADAVGGEAVSGVLPPSGAGMQATYRLKILDIASMFDLNGPAEVLGLQLTNLGKILSARHGRPILASGTVTSILALREERGTFGDRRELLEAGLLSEEDFALVADLVTTRSHPDPTTVRALSAYPDGTEVSARALPRFELSPRAPLNLNTAGLEVLSANMAGAEGVWFDDNDPERPGRTIARRMTIPLLTAMRVAEEIVAIRAQPRAPGSFGGPFASRSQWEAFVDSVYQRQILNRVQADMLKRMADPDNIPSGIVGKLGLVAYGTEFAFSAGGRFEIQSSSRVLDARGETIARSWLRTVVDIYQEWTDSTFADFLQGEASAVDGQISRGRPTENGGTTTPHPEMVGDPQNPLDPATVNGGVRISRYTQNYPPETTFLADLTTSLVPTVAAGGDQPVLPAGLTPSDLLTGDGILPRNGSGVAYPLVNNFPTEKGTLSLTYRPNWQIDYGYSLLTLFDATTTSEDEKNFYSYSMHVFNYCGVPYLLVQILAPPAVTIEALYYLGDDFVLNNEEKQFTVEWDLTRDPDAPATPTDRLHVYIDGQPVTPDSIDILENTDYFRPDDDSPAVGTPLDPSRVPGTPLFRIGTTPDDTEVTPTLPSTPSYPRHGLLTGLGDSYLSRVDPIVDNYWSEWWPWGMPANDDSLYSFLASYFSRYEPNLSREDFRARMTQMYGRPSGDILETYGWWDWVWTWDMPEEDHYPPLLAYAVPRWHDTRTLGRLRSAEGTIRNFILLDAAMGGAWARQWYAGDPGAMASANEYYPGTARFSRTLPAEAAGSYHRLAGIRYHERWTANPSEGVRLTVHDGAGELGFSTEPAGPGTVTSRAIRGAVTYDLDLALVAAGDDGTVLESPLVDEITLRFVHPPRAILRENLSRGMICLREPPTEPVRLPELVDPPAEDQALPEEVYADLEGGHWNPYHEVPILPADVEVLVEDDPQQNPPSSMTDAKRDALDEVGQGGGSSPRYYDPTNPYADQSAGFGPWSGGPGARDPSRSPSAGSGRPASGGGPGLGGGAPGSNGPTPGPGGPGKSPKKGADKGPKSKRALGPSATSSGNSGDGTAPENQPGPGGGGGGGDEEDRRAVEDYKGWLRVTVLAGGDPVGLDVKVVAVNADGSRIPLKASDEEGVFVSPPAGLVAGRYEVEVTGPSFLPVKRPVAVIDRRETSVKIEVEGQD
ncbi:MAG: carboxypeptidase regulatory-like domain-containing protein [Planctomycetes bacterium]|nr:carboxypeptidase regulatory-like domain-containing protein [Planctomycetota bacterium]